MMKLKMLLAFVLVAGFGCVAEVSARQVQRRVGKPVPIDYKARLERIQSSGGFNARRGVRGGKFERREGIHPQELELMMLQGQELDEDQQAQLREFHAANPGIAEQFNQAMLDEGFEAEAFEAVMPTKEEVEEGEKPAPTPSNQEVKAAIKTEIVNIKPTDQEVLAATKEIEEELNKKSTVSAPEEEQAANALAQSEAILAKLRKELDNPSLNTESKNNITKLITAQEEVIANLKKEKDKTGEGRAKAIARAVYVNAKQHYILTGMGLILGAGILYATGKAVEARSVMAGVTALKNVVTSTASCTKEKICSATKSAWNWITRTKTPDALVGTGAQAAQQVMPQQAVAVGEAASAVVTAAVPTLAIAAEGAVVAEVANAAQAVAAGVVPNMSPDQAQKLVAEAAQIAAGSFSGGVSTQPMLEVAAENATDAAQNLVNTFLTPTQKLDAQRVNLGALAGSMHEYADAAIATASPVRFGTYQDYIAETYNFSAFKDYVAASFNFSGFKEYADAANAWLSDHNYEWFLGGVSETLQEMPSGYIGYQG